MKKRTCRTCGKRKNEEREFYHQRMKGKTYIHPNCKTCYKIKRCHPGKKTAQEGPM